ncbi:MAG: molybdopterin-dependent oxidoreductase [Methanobrevibacter sp.]|jgi:formate dehydrogenase major subunit|nr:molybdopterin-dependent oxidoreductase [Methanobrevibacter sp.]
MLIKHSICPSCSVGCGINLINKNGKIVGTYPYKNHPINEGKNCLRGKNIYKIVDENRILIPLKKEQNKLVESNWEDVINLVSNEFKSYSPEEIGILISGTNTNEENELISKFAKGQKITNVGVYADNFPKFNKEIGNYDDLNDAKSILLIGDIIKENPLIGRRIIIAKENGAKIFSVDDVNQTTTSINSTKHFKTFSITKFLEEFPQEIKDELGKSSLIVFNKIDLKEDFDKIVKIAEDSNSKILPVLKDCNSFDAINKVPPLNKEEIAKIINSVKLLLLINIDIFSFFDESEVNIHIPKYLISITHSLNESSSVSNIVLPSYCWAEKSGTFTNTAGEVQSFDRVIKAPENALEEIQILKMIEKKLKA